MTDREKDAAQATSEFPMGKEYIEVTRQLENDFSALAREMLNSDQLGRNIPILYERTGDALSLLYRFATCAWGCHGGDHLFEDNVRRICNFGHSALKLCLGGYYDESLALTRGIGEIVNLMQLFSLDAAAAEDWAKSSSEDRRDRFLPGHVRKRIDEQHGETPLMSKEVYGQLCQIGVHVSPVSEALSHSIDGRLYVGTHFSPPALGLCLRQLSEVLAGALEVTANVGDLEDTQRGEMRETAKSIRDAFGWVDVLEFKGYIERFQGEFMDAQVTKYWESLSEDSRQEIYVEAAKEVVPILNERDDADDLDISDDEVQAVMQQVLTKQVRSRVFRHAGPAMLGNTMNAARLAAAREAQRDAERFRSLGEDIEIGRKGNRDEQ